MISFPQFPLNKLTELLRQDMAAAGFTEALTFALVCCTRVFCPANGFLLTLQIPCSVMLYMNLLRLTKFPSSRRITFVT